MKIHVFTADTEISINVHPGLTLFEHLKNNEIYVSSICGGMGTCNKCRIKLETGFLPILEIDQKNFSTQELKEGWRLSCQSRPRANCSIRIPGVENLRLKPRVRRNHVVLHDPVIACDLGSTGVVMGIGDGFDSISVEAHLLNKQIRYGSDVMTRLHAAQRYGTEALKDALHKTLRQCLKTLEEEDPQNYLKAIQKPIICSGNSAMVSFLQNFDITPLAVSPFQPEKTQTTQSKLDSLTLETPPLLGGFIGADTTAALAYMNYLQACKPCIMIDIGTNTEIVFLTSQDELIFTSTPAGPAFEGGSITKGMRAEPGAISELCYKDNEWHYKTIGHDVPRGLCGSGLIDAIAQGLKHRFIEADGLLNNDPILRAGAICARREERRVLNAVGGTQATQERSANCAPAQCMYFCERVYLTANDIREFQLAKSAIRTAVDMLIDRAKETPKKIYLAGTFAENLNHESIRMVGLLPAEIPFESIGNASFKGSFILAKQHPSVRKKFYEDLEKNKKHIELALQDDFQERFIHHLNFYEIEDDKKSDEHTPK